MRVRSGLDRLAARRSTSHIAFGCCVSLTWPDRLGRGKIVMYELTALGARLMDAITTDPGQEAKA
jgi:hypothetical protein